MYRVFIHMVKSTNSLAFIGWTHCHELKEYEECWFYVRKEIITSPNSKVCCFGLFLLNSHLHNNGNVLCIKVGLYHHCVHVAQMFYIYSFVKVKVDNRLLNAEDAIFNLNAAVNHEQACTAVGNTWRTFRILCWKGYIHCSCMWTWCSQTLHWKDWRQK